MKKLLVITLVVVGLLFAGVAVADTPISTALAPHIATNQVAMTEAAALIKAANPSRRSLVICNAGSNTFYIGETSGVTSSNGFPVFASSCITLDRSLSAVYGICAGGKTSTAAYLEE